jgi:hypothetical protein
MDRILGVKGAFTDYFKLNYNKENTIEKGSKARRPYFSIPILNNNGSSIDMETKIN